ncbi:DUF1194 domain-containing protein [Sedimentitalea sp. XS_ASV28]|uniref:DUF1194 domain-containing protein n=1 Tax=Sedimentitalea sp. XS_ASV28 TaxID=3241296 RepID=UPI0035159A11
MRRAAAVALAVAGAAGATDASECRLALALAIDVSSSVDAAEDRLQRNGLAAALIAPEVRRAFFATDLPVALAIYEWSGRYNQEIILDWRLITDQNALLDAARRVGQSTRSHNAFPTAIGYALGYGAGLLSRAPQCLFRTLDMAGDGVNNEGFGPAAAYAEFPFDGVTVNGLVVNAGEYEAEVALIDYYRDEILRGPGAFLEIASGFDDYERAMRRKLERELDVPSLGALSGPNEAG